MSFYHLYTKEVREIPHGILKLTLPRLATPAVKAVEVLGCHGESITTLCI